MNKQGSHSIIGISVLFLSILLLCACNATKNSNLVEMTGTQLTPTMHTAFQLTPASERMPDPIPVEGFGMYEIVGLGSGSGNSVAETSTAIPQSEETTIVEALQDGRLSGSGNSLVVGELQEDANQLVANQVIVVTPRPQQPSTSVKPAVSVNVAQAQLPQTQPLPASTPLPINAATASSTTPNGTPTVTFTPTPICGGNQFHKVGPAHRVDRMPIEFEEFGTWMRSENTFGAFLQTNLLQKSGPTAAWLCYFFYTPEDETAVFTQIHPVPGQPNTVRMWVYGNRSGHFLGVWILDREQETWLVPLGPIIHEGWEEVEATFAGPNAGSIFYISGPSNQRIDYPISFRGISLNDSPDASITYGGVVIDAVSFITK